MDRSFYKSPLEIVVATIDLGESLSDAIDLGGLRLFRIVMPAEWTAAGLTIQTSDDEGASFQPLKDAAGTEYPIVATANDSITVDPVVFSSIAMLKIQSGTSDTPVAQAAERQIKLILRNI